MLQNHSTSVYILGIVHVCLGICLLAASTNKTKKSLLSQNKLPLDMSKKLYEPPSSFFSMQSSVLLAGACLACFATLWCHPQKIANSIKPFDNSIQGRHVRFFPCKTAPGAVTSLLLPPHSISKIQARPTSHRCYLLGQPYHLMPCILLKDLTKMRFCINSCLKGGVM